MKKIIIVLFMSLIASNCFAEVQFTGFEEEGKFFKIYCDLSFKGGVQYIPPTNFSKGTARFILINRSYKEFDLKYAKYYAVDKENNIYQLVFNEMVCEYDLRRKNFIPAQTEVEVRCSTPENLTKDAVIEGFYIRVNEKYTIYFGVTNWWLKVLKKIEDWVC